MVYQPQLLDLLHAVPRLMDGLPCKDIRSMAAISKGFHRVVQQQVTRVRMKPNRFRTQTQLTEIVPCFVSGAWTQLQHLHISFGPTTHPPECIHAVLQAGWPALRTLDLQNTCLGDDAISLLVARPWPILSCLSKTGLSTDACLELLKGDWPLMKTVNLGWIHLDAGFFKHMVAGSRLLHLTALHLPGTKLDKAAVSELVHYQARLRVLHLEWNRLPGSVMSVLSQARWATLEVLDLYNCAHIDMEAVQCLARAAWPRLSNLRIDPKVANKDPVTMVVLSQANWPCLRTICLSHNTLTLSACAALGSASWPLLEKLSVAVTDIGADHIQHLVQAHWPLLSCLDLRYNLINERGIELLLKGRWPALRCLLLTGNIIAGSSMTALYHLGLGSWHGLETLELVCVRRVSML